MNIQQLCDTIDLDKRDFSLVLVSPKETILEWLGAFWKRKGLEYYRNYIPEENTILVIPSIGRFSKYGVLESFLDEMKPKLLYRELVRFHVSPEECGRPLTKSTFDETFDIALRDSTSIHFMSDFKNL